MHDHFRLASGRTAADRLAAAGLGVAAAIPALILAFLMFGLVGAVAEEAGPARCSGTDLVDQLKADGRFAAVEAKAKAIPNGDARFFEISRPGVASSFLLGTMHLTDPRVAVLPPAAERAFEESKRLVIETTDVLDPQQAAGNVLAHPELINLPKDKTLLDLLSGDEAQTLKAALSQRGIPFQAIRTLQPWFTSVSLMMPACETERKAEGGDVLDVALANRAIAAGKPVDGLESAQEQLQALASLPLKFQVESLMATVRLADRMPDILETMLSLYLDGQIAAIMPAIEAAVPDGGILVGQGEGYGQFERSIVTDRNDRMASRLKPLLVEGGVFVAVGALHLPGEEGLVAQLRNNGWTVVPVD